MEILALLARGLASNFEPSSGFEAKDRHRFVAELSRAKAHKCSKGNYCFQRSVSINMTQFKNDIFNRFINLKLKEFDLIFQVRSSVWKTV